MSRAINQASLLGPLLVATLMGSLSCAPSDRVLLKRFENQKGSFDELMRLALEDRRVCTFKRSDVAHLSIPADRQARYSHLMDVLEIKAVNCFDTGACELTLYVGLTDSASSYKGYAYCSQPPGNLYSSLDGRPSGLSEGETGFRRMEGHWYLYLE